MKKTLFAMPLIAVMFIVIMTLGFKPGKSVDYKINTEKSMVTWHGYKVLGEHTGNVNIKGGNLEFKDDFLVGGEFEIDMASITCTDLEDEATNAKLLAHLTSEDFFGVEEYPTATFKISSAVPYGAAGRYKIVGKMTIKKSTEEIKFLADVNVINASVEANAEVEIDRSDYDVRYGSGTFFGNLGDNTIYDEFKLDIKLVADKDK